jgi:hypothetical protein
MHRRGPEAPATAGLRPSVHKSLAGGPGLETGATHFQCAPGEGNVLQNPGWRRWELERAGLRGNWEPGTENRKPADDMAGGQISFCIGDFRDR